MWKPDPRPKPEDVGCVVFKPCDRKCGKCKQCDLFSSKLLELLPNDVESGYRPQHTFEWRER